MGDFSNRAFAVVSRIPRGKVATYGQVARLMGSPRSARYVGFALRSNPRPGTGPGAIPCHRVVFKDGSLCKGFAFGGPGAQYELLENEGVSFVDQECEGGPRVDMRTCQWDGMDADDAAYPTQPPPDFDWAAELGEV